LSEEKYWIVDNNGSVVMTYLVHSSFENERFNFGNCFKTKEEAEEARDKIKEVLNK